MGKDLVNELFKFINSDESVTMKKLQEASDAAYAGVGKENADMLKEHNVFIKKMGLTAGMPKADEGVVVSNPANIDKPEEVIQTLAEEKKSTKAPKAAKTDVKSADRGIVADPEKGPLQKSMDKATPDVDKKSDFQVAAKVSKAKVLQPEPITGVTTPKGVKVGYEEEGSSAELEEGTVVANPANIDKPEEVIQTLAEERALVAVSDQNIANDIKSKYPGSRIVQDADKKQWIVMVQEKAAVQEEKTSSPTESEIKAASIPEVDAVERNKLTNISKADPKEPAIKAAVANVSKSDMGDKAVGDKGASTAKQHKEEKKPSADTGKADQNASSARHDATQKPLQTKTGPDIVAKPEIKDVNTVAGTSAAKQDKLTTEAKVQEDAEVTVTADDKTATISMTADGVNVSTSGATAEPSVVEPAEGEIEPEADQDMEDAEADEMAERIFVSDYLATLEEAKLTEKQKAFIAEVKAKKLSKKNADKVGKKVKVLKDKADKKCC